MSTHFDRVCLAVPFGVFPVQLLYALVTQHQKLIFGGCSQGNPASTSLKGQGAH